MLARRGRRATPGLLESPETAGPGRHRLSESLLLHPGEMLDLGLFDSGFHKKIYTEKAAPDGAAFSCYSIELDYLVTGISALPPK